MLDFPEACQRRRANALRRRVGGDQLRVLLLERSKFLQQSVVLGVGHFRRIERMVGVVEVFNLFTQRLDTRLGS